MPTTAKNTKKKKKEKKYNMNPKAKLDKGIDWDMHMIIPPDIGYKLIEENENNGADYKFTMVKALRKGLGLKENP